MLNNITKILLFSLVLAGLTSCSDNETMPRNKKQVSAKEQLIEANRVLIKKDKQRITRHIKRMHWNMVETETGLWYEIIKEGVGEFVKESNRISISYSVTLLDGTPCYSSDETGIKTFVVGRGGVESGLEQAVLLCKKETQARFILPPHLAWGLPGDGNKIPARSTIVYEIEVLEIENK